jgi:hypothetical protein
MNFVYLRSYMLKLFAFFLDSCIVTKGEKFVHALGTWECLEGVQIGLGNFWAVWCRAGLLGRSIRPQAVSWGAGDLTALWRRSNHPGHVKQFLLFAAFPCCIVALVQGEWALAQGELAYVQGELFVVFEFWLGSLRSLFEHGFVSDVSSRCPCLRGPRLVFFKWSCSSPFFGFRSLVEVSFYLFLFFFSLVLIHVGVVNTLIEG